MSARFRHAILVGVCMGVLLVLSGEAQAFFPLGGFNETNKLVIARWSYAAMNDRNNDGDISGPDEGVEIMLEGGTLGWTDDEMQIVEDAFQVWEDVPTSYAATQIRGINQDPIASLAGVNDLLNYVSVEVPGDLVTGGVGGGVLGVTTITYAIDDTTFQLDNLGFTYSGGQIIEADITIDGLVHRPAAPGQDPLVDLKGTLVHEIGHFFGLMHTPLNNVELVTIQDLPVLVESPVYAQRDVAGQLGLVGATPTMFPIYFLTDDGRGEYTAGQEDLAPDDISGISFMYPRGSQDKFFTISQEARTLTRPNFPSIPVMGGHVVAWCDVDSDPATPRIPLFSTMSGLYVSPLAPLEAGRFDLYGLLKVIETVGATSPFEANYTLSISPLNSLDFERQAPVGYMAADFDSIDGGVDVYNPAFPSEVFHETGNLFDVDMHNVGTPLAFDEERQQVVSVDSGKSLATILPGLEPMFGDRNDLCPWNVVLGGLSSQSALPRLRAFRDTVLLRSTLGTALVDMYYHAAPTMARFLVAHTGVVRVFQGLAQGLGWLGASYRMVLALVLGVILVGIAYARRRRATAIVMALLAAALLVAAPANARIQYLTEEDMVALSDQIVTATVHRAESAWQEFGSHKRIVTQVTLIVEDTVKGGLNKEALIFLDVLGGRVGSVVTWASELPTFKKGEKALVYLQYREDYGYVVVAGCRGKCEIETDTETKEQYVYGATVQAKSGLSRVQDALNTEKSAPAKGQDSAKVRLEDFKQYLRSIVKEQEQE